MGFVKFLCIIFHQLCLVLSLHICVLLYWPQSFTLASRAAQIIDEYNKALGSHVPTLHPQETVISQGRWYRHGRNISHHVVKIPCNIDRDTQTRREKPSAWALQSVPLVQNHLGPPILW